jgi:hypothetical protein
LRITRAIASFVGHQLFSMIGISALAPITLFSLVPALRLFGSTVTISDMRVVLTQTPGFPVQIVIGLLAGFSIERLLKQEQLKWVWVLPLVVLLGAFVLRSGGGPSFEARFRHFFGRGCRPEKHCFDQLGFTLPFYASVAYSLGAFLSDRVRKRSSIERDDKK